MAGADLTDARWVLGVSTVALQREVGVLSVGRAQTYAEQGRVVTLVSASGGRQLLSTVRGTARGTYSTIVFLVDERGPQWGSTCSCPVRVQCKHGVATILAAQQRLEAEGHGAMPTWEALLAPLVQAPRNGEEAARLWPLGLQVSLRRGHGGLEESTQILLAPVRPGRAKPWVRQGVAWRDLTSPFASRSVLPEHRSALAPLVSLGSSASYYHYASAELPLGALGALAWPTLRHAEHSGVELVPGESLGAVRLGTGEVEIGLDLTRLEDGGLRAVAEVRDDKGARVRGEELFVVGRPGHGVGRLTQDGELTLWPMPRPPAPVVVRLLERGEAVEVPPEQVDRFLAHYYPAIARQVSVRSHDESVPSSADLAPRLHLQVRPEPGHRLVLSWSFGYAVPVTSGDPVTTLVGLERRSGDPPRDLAAEAMALVAVLPLLEPLPDLLQTGPGGTRGIRPRRTLTGRTTVAFATEVLPLLEASEHVDVVLDGDLATYEEADEAPVITLETTEGSADDWFDLHVTVTVAGQQVPFEELFAALARDEEVMLLESGTWFPLDQPELHSLRRLIEEARELDDRPPGAGRVGLTRWQAGLWEELTGFGVLGRQSALWQESVDALLALGDADRGRARVPGSLTVQLRPYQLEGFDWLSRLWDSYLGGVLADDMGLGKTLQTISMIARAEDRGDLAEGPVLVVAPASVVAVWAAEAARFAPGLKVATVSATRARRGTDLATTVGAADLVVTSYTLLRLEQDDYSAMPWSALVLDEAQAVKNHRSATYRAVRGIGAPRTFVITGTPLENSLMDLWAMFSLAAPGLFGPPATFVQRYRKPIEDGGSPEVLERLRRRIRPFLLRRTKVEVAQDLPEKIEQTLAVPLHPQHRRIYDKHLQRERQRVLGLLEDPDKNRILILRALTVLRQLALDPGLVDPEHAGRATSSKITTLLEHLAELTAEGHRALVFSSFTGYLALVRAALDEAGVGYTYLDGRTRDRPARVARFRDGDDPVFLISLKAGGVGLTLTEADYVFMLDPWWNPAVEAQAVDRTHRIGQTRPVHVYRLVSSGTVEEKVVGLQERKRRLFANVVETGEFGSGQITVDDIRALLQD